MPGLCHPYGAGIECTCNDRGVPVHCLPVVTDYQAEEEMFNELSDSLHHQEEYRSHEVTEAILATTLIVLIILAFVG